MALVKYVVVYGNPIPDGTAFVEVAQVELDHAGKPICWQVLIGEKNSYSDFAGFAHDPDVREHSTMFMDLDPDNIRLPAGFVFDEDYKQPGSHDDTGFCIHDGKIFILCG